MPNLKYMGKIWFNEKEIKEGSQSNKLYVFASL